MTLRTLIWSAACVGASLGSMGCAGSTESGAGPHLAETPGGGSPPTSQSQAGSAAFVSKSSKNKAGSAFEFLDDQQKWQRIGDHYVINKLGELCAGKAEVVEYRVGANQLRTTLGANGILSQTNVATGMQRPVRLMPFFFEYEEGPRKWLPVTDPPALIALTAVVVSSSSKEYVVTNHQGGTFG